MNEIAVAAVADTHLAVACDRALDAVTRRRAWDAYEDERWFQAALEGLRGIPTLNFRRLESRLTRATVACHPAR